MAESGLRKRVLLDVVASPWVLIPAAVGGTLLMGAWAVDKAQHVLAFMGLASLAVSAGSLVTRWITSKDQIIDRALQQEQSEARRNYEKRLDDLHQRLLTDGDPRTEHAMAMLRDLQSRLKAVQTDPRLRPPVEIVVSAQKLADSSQGGDRVGGPFGPRLGRGDTHAIGAGCVRQADFGEGSDPVFESDLFLRFRFRRQQFHIGHQEDLALFHFCPGPTVT